MEDPYRLSRFIEAQEPVYQHVLDELQSGIKRGHWIWYIFPQIVGLGLSPMSNRYAIKSIEEARAFLDHPVLGPRLIECVQIVTALEGRSVQQIFGHPDYLKFRSCLTLFHAAQIKSALFQHGLDKYFGGKPDQLTIDALAGLEPEG